jgi:hypothetical protein
VQRKEELIMANEIIEIPSERPAALALTRDAVGQLQNHRKLLMEYVRGELKQDVDYGIIPGTDKPTLYKPGGEKLRGLFAFQTETVMADKELDRSGNFALFTYRTTVRDKYGNALVSCEGSCNSQEKKYRERKVYDWVDMKRQDGSTFRKKVEISSEPTPVCDVLNTLMKMAQKRSFVGAVILATGASDFFNQDIDDPEDAATLGITPKQGPAPVIKVSVPGVTAAASQSQSQSTQATPEAGPPNCQLCGTQMRLSRNQDAYTCPNWQDKKNGDHSYVRI